MGWKIDVPDVPPSLNKVLRMHWARRRSLKDSWMAQIAVRARLAGWKVKPVDVKVRGIITIHNARTYDKDNAYGACKIIFDALKTLGLIVDDRKEWFDVDVRQEKCKRKDRHTVIELELAAQQE